MKLLSTLIVLLSSMIPSLGAVVFPPSLTGNNVFTGSNTFFGTNKFSKPVTFDDDIILQSTIDLNTGVIFKGTNYFMHNYSSPGSEDGNTFLGVNAGNFTMGPNGGAANLGSRNTVFGNGSLTLNTTGFRNSAFGTFALANNTTGEYNMAVGDGALRFNTTGDFNVAVGGDSLSHNVIGIYNVAFGIDSLQLNTNGSWNTAIGGNALNSNLSGGNNHSIGANSLINNISGSYNVAIGSSALASNLNSGNIGIGQDAGKYPTNAYRSIFIGYQAGNGPNQKLDATNSFALGDNNFTTADNQIVIGNVNVVSTIIAGNVGFGMTPAMTPQALVSVRNPYTTLGTLYPIVVSQLSSSTTILGGMYSVPEGDQNGASGLSFETYKQGTGLIEALRISNVGNVGIGTTTPANKLSVNGDIGAMTITLTNNPTFQTTNAAPAGFILGTTLPKVWFAITNAGTKYLIPGFLP